VGVPLPLWVPIAVAVIASAGVLVAATLTAYATASRERQARRAERESERLAELAEAALALREAALAPPAAETENALRRASGTFVVRREAVPLPRVRELACEWERALRDVPDDAVEPSREERAWLALLHAIGRARRGAV
jgi:hypothetical protein